MKSLKLTLIFQWAPNTQVFIFIMLRFFSLAFLLTFLLAFLSTLYNFHLFWNIVTKDLIYPCIYNIQRITEIPDKTWSLESNSSLSKPLPLPVLKASVFILFLVRKYFKSEKKFGSEKNFESQKNCWSKTNFGSKNFGSKNFWSKKILGQKKF